MSDNQTTEVMNHFVMRTSPFGGEFWGTCRLCGQENLPAEAALEECPNPRGLGVAEALLEVLDNHG